MYEDTKLILDYNARQEAKENFRNRQRALTEAAEQADYDAIGKKLALRGVYRESLIDLRKKATDAFMVEAVTILVDNCLPTHLVTEDYHQKLVRQLATNFVNEEGSLKLLNKFKRTSYLLSEVAYAVDTTVQSVMERAAKDETKTLKLDNTTKNEFYSKLEKVDVDKAIDKIKDRVMTQQQEFVDNKLHEKAALGAALDKTSNKVEDNKAKLKEKANDKKAQESAAKIEEGYINLGKRRITDIRNSSTKNIFECMVYNLSKAAMVNESAGNVFIEDSKLNMEKIVEHCETLCTFITTLDSLKIINVNEEYIENMLHDMKK